jgi:proteasome lid subunit RPN8/RPN11
MQTQDKDKAMPAMLPEPRIVDAIPDWPAGLVISRKEKISVSIAEDTAVILTQNAFEQLFGWTYSTSREISCLGSVIRRGNWFVIERFYLLRQSGSSASTELDELAVAAFMEQLMAEGKRDEVSRIKCWAHSHPNMDTFWSKTDDQTCRLLVNDYLISIVVGSDFKIRCRIDVAAPIPVVFDAIPVVYQMPKDELQMAKYAQEVRSVVSENPVILSKVADRQGSRDRNELVPEIYCGYCGGFHAEGDCPLAGAEHWPQILDGEDFMF